MPVSPKDWASPPTFTPNAYRLRGAVDGPHQFTGHQKLGLYYQPDVCTRPLETSTQCLTGAGAPKVSQGGANWRGANPFVVYTWLDCSLVGSDEEKLKAETLAAHNNGVQATVENVFWSGGAYGTYPRLAYTGAPITEVVNGSTVTLQTSATVPVTGIFDIVEAVGLLEYNIGLCYGGRPILHMPQLAVAHMAANHLLVEKNGKLFTFAGSQVVGAPGYLRTGPDGTAPANNGFWIYATGAVKWWQSDVRFMAHDVKELLGRSTNDTVLIAEQWFALGWDCCHFAMQVSGGGVITGTPASAT